MDYAFLRQEGIRWLERLSGGQWTDFNEHDPGITILEQLCYALSDLSYRTGYSIPDLLAEGGADPYASLPPPEEILPSAPVTPDDLRRLVLDVDGVRNAWVEPLTAEALQLYYCKRTHELRMTLEDSKQRESPTVQHSRVLGLYRVLIETSASPARQNSDIKADVARRLAENRGLCEDFNDITLVERQLVKVLATVEVHEVDDLAALWHEIRRTLDEELSPSVCFSTLDTLLETGSPLEEIFEGPRLRKGFLKREALAGATRKTTIHTSDLLRAIMGVKGVRAVSRIAVSIGDTWDPWSLAIEPKIGGSLAIEPKKVVARLDIGGSKITLRRQGKTLLEKPPDEGPATPAASALVQAPVTARAGGVTLVPPRGRSRAVGRYSSVQRQLPRLYGVGEQGLPGSASVERKARALQLKAYLLFFDQLLANSFAQLAHVKELYSFEAKPQGEQTYFTQMLDDPGLGFDDIREPSTAPSGDPTTDLQNLVEETGSAAALERKNRFFNHLLARFAEPVGQHAQTASAKERAQRKQRLLRGYPKSSRARGQGADLLDPSPAVRSGLQTRLELRLGFLEASFEQIILIENILLRPIKEELPAEVPSKHPNPWSLVLAEEWSRDPYSMQITLVLADGQGPFAVKEAKPLFEQTLRVETPSHITPYVLWMEPGAFSEFQAAHKVWRQRLTSYTEEMTGNVPAKPEWVPRTEAERIVLALALRGARDRIIDLLGIGETNPLPDTQATLKESTITFGTQPVIVINPSQARVRYTLYVDDAPVVPSCSVDGTGDQVLLFCPPLKEVQTYRILAEKLDRPTRRVFLNQTPTVKVGLRTSLRALVKDLNPRNPVIDYGSSIIVSIESSQSGVSYQLIDPNNKTISVAPVSGTGDTISLVSSGLEEDLIVRIQATGPMPGSSKLEQVNLDAQLAVAVRANPGPGVRVSGAAIADFGGRATLLIDKSQRSVTYHAYGRWLSDADFLPAAPIDTGVVSAPVPGAPDVLVASPPRPANWKAQPEYVLLGSVRGNDDKVELSLGPMQEDCVVVVKAEKDHSGVMKAEPNPSSRVQTESQLQLTQAALILVRPDPLPALTLQLLPGADGCAARLLVHGGKPGVLYRFRRFNQDVELSRPAYFHKLDADNADFNKGIGQLRIERDFIVTREPQPALQTSVYPPDRAPMPPEVYLGSVPTERTLVVMAVKVRTGVSWTANRTFPVDVVPSAP